ncbi:MAG: hypothetical protein ACI4S2_01490 [Lachnospiraceae bacterium]
MAGYENIKDANSNRTPEERRELAIKAGKASGKARRRTSNLRDTMNKLLTMKVEVDGLSDVLRADGGESTYEEVITMAMIQQAMLGDVKAYKAIMQVVGQTNKSDADLEEQKSKVELNRAKKDNLTGESETDEALEKLDAILKGVYENAVKQEAE